MRRGGRRYGLVGPLLALVVAIEVTTTALPASAVQTVPANSVTAVREAGIALHVPRDGRVNGDGFAATVTGYRFGYGVGFGSSAEVAAPGQALLVFGLEEVGSGGSFTLVVDGQGTPLPASDLSPASLFSATTTSPPGLSPSTPAYYLASVPAHADNVGLQASAAGFSQTFSFTKGAREGSQPAVLYRAQSAWQQTDSVGLSVNVPTPASADIDGIPTSVGGGVDIDIASVTLGYFLGASGTTPGNPAKAWLEMSATALPYAVPDDQEYEWAYQQTLPGRDLTLTLPGGKPLPAMLTGQGGPDDESNEESNHDGLFGGDYYWEVPAGVRSATLRVHLPAHLVAQVDNSSLMLTGKMSVPVERSVPPVHVVFSPAWSPPPPSASNPPAWTPKDAASLGGTQSAASTGSSSSASLGLVILLLFVAALGALGYVFFRRRRPRLAMLTASAEQKRAMGVEEFLPAPPTGPLGSARVPDSGGGSSGLAGSAPTSSLAPAPATSPEPAPWPPEPCPAADDLGVPVPTEPAPLPPGALELQLIGPVRLAGEVPAGANELIPAQLETLAALLLQGEQGLQP